MKFKERESQLYDLYVQISSELENKFVELIPEFDTQIDHIRKTLKEGQELSKNQISFLKDTLFKDLMEDRTHGPHEGLYCWGPCCLYHGYKLIHERSKKQKDNFFFVWLLYLSAPGTLRKKSGRELIKVNWDFTENLLFDISGKNFPLYGYPVKNEKYRVYNRYKKVLNEITRTKLEIIEFLKDPKMVDFIPRIITFEAIRRIIKEEDRMIKRAAKFVSKKKPIGNRQLYKHLRIKASDLASVVSKLPEFGILSDKQKKTNYTITELQNQFDYNPDDIKKDLIYGYCNSKESYGSLSEYLHKFITF